ncbi:MAG: RNA polymerase sigma factor [Acidobacteriota bacterium]|nr:RNA polymerase sigma factor [Candidatus Aminicenantes bacterium]
MLKNTRSPSSITSAVWWERENWPWISLRIEKVLDQIPPALRELFVWRHINEFSYEEIAEIKDLPLGTIKNRVYQAKELIRRHMEKIT